MSFTDTRVPSSAFYDRIFDESLNQPLDRDVLIDAANPDHSFTLGDIKRGIPILASKLRTVWQDFEEGDVIAQCSPNDITLLVAAQGFIYAGATVAPVDHTRHDEDAIVRDMRTAKAKFIITHPKILQRVLRVAEKLSIPKNHILICGDQVIEDVACICPLLEGDFVEDGALTIKDRDIRDPAFLLFTSGTTGANKAVKISYRSILHSFDRMAISDHKSASPIKRVISFSQFYHGSGAMSPMSIALLNAVPMYIMESFNIQDFCEYVQRYKVTTTFMMPYAALSIARDPLVSNYDLTSLTEASVLGEHPDPSLVHDFEAKFRIDLLNLYGMTETSAPFESKVEYMKRGAIGTLLPGVAIKLIDNDGNEAKEGELWVKGPNVTPGYFNNEEANKQSFDEDGFFCTGDIFRVDDDGVYTFVSRKKDLIKYHAYRIISREVEEFVFQAPNVARCAVVGIYDDQACTQLLTAFIEPTEKEDQGELNEDTKKMIAQGVMDYVDTHVPEDSFRLRGGVIIVNKLPLNSLGKVLRNSMSNHTGAVRHATFQQIAH